MLKKNKSFIVFIVFALLCALWALLTNSRGELFYVIFAQYLILPVTSLVCSILCVKKGTVLGWISPIIFAGITIVLPFLALNLTDLAFAVFALVPAVLGYIIGGICYSIKNY